MLVVRRAADGSVEHDRNAPRPTAPHAAFWRPHPAMPLVPLRSRDGAGSVEASAAVLAAGMARCPPRAPTPPDAPSGAVAPADMFTRFGVQSIDDDPDLREAAVALLERVAETMDQPWGAAQYVFDPDAYGALLATARDDLLEALDDPHWMADMAVSCMPLRAC